MLGSSRKHQTSSAPPDGGQPELPIEDHAVIGDLRTVALVAKDGGISFMCMPRFDSPTVFARLLDPDGGTFRVAPVGDGARTAQRYMPDTNVLVTRIGTSDGLAEAIDWMPVAWPEDREGESPQYLVRQLRILRGAFEFELVCAPRFDYGRAGHTFAFAGPGNAVFAPEAGQPPLVLQSTVPLTQDGGDARARFTLDAGQTACFVLVFGPDDPAAPIDADAIDASFRDTAQWWHDWLAGSSYRGRWREMVDRSALVLKLMTSARYGAMVAAPTFGLPERAGGRKNWDYRYCWIRDASFAMYAFVRLGLVDEMAHFVDWVASRVEECAQGDGPDGPLRIMYGLDGRTALPEVEIEGMRGWAGSRPVRIGNGAAEQLQLDIYGELIDAFYLANKYGRAASYEGWQNMVATIDWLRVNWRRPDHGIWESRGERQEYLFSRLMCWVAIDRAIRLAQKRSLPAPLPEWNQSRLEIYNSIHTEFWRADLDSFVHAKGSDTVDGALLLMPLVRFISATDPRWLGTMKRIGETLVVDALVFRRPPAEEQDQPGGEEGSFLACSFWYVEALARSGDLQRARLLFDKLVGYANHVGLYAEELSFSGRHLGNFPQVLTHLALISAASYLDRSLGGAPKGQWT